VYVCVCWGARRGVLNMCVGFNELIAILKGIVSSQDEFVPGIDKEIPIATPNHLQAAKSSRSFPSFAPAALREVYPLF
jgi:hypothetical protein